MTHAPLLILLACIEPQAPTQTAPEAAGTVPPEAMPPAAPTGDAAAAGGTPGAPPPKDGPTNAGAPPKNLADLVGAKPSVDLTLTLDGAPSAVVDFIVESPNGPPQIIAQDRVSSATTTLKVPATYDSPMWVTAFYDADQNGPDAKDPAAMSPTPIKLEGKPVSVTLKMAPGNFPPKIGADGQRPVPAGTAPPAVAQPAAGTLPAGAPPPGSPPALGAAPTGAPAAGAAPAAGTAPAPAAAPPAAPSKGAPPAKAPAGK